MPPLPTDFIFPEACKPICEKLLTLPWQKTKHLIWNLRKKQAEKRKKRTIMFTQNGGNQRCVVV